MGRYSQSKKLPEPSEPSLCLSGVVQVQTQKTLPRRAADADPGPHLPKSSNDYVKRSTLSQGNGKRRARTQREGLVCLKLGRQKGKQKNSPPLPQNGGGKGGIKKKGGGGGEISATT